MTSLPGVVESVAVDVDAALEQSIRDIGIPARPQVLDLIDAEMHKDEPDFNRLGQLIAADVALAAGLIKTVNSPYFGLNRRAHTVQEALLLMGLDNACRAVAGLSLRRVFPASPQMERFWDASARIAMLSGWMAERLRKPRLRPEDAYTYGLFRDCGIPVLMLRHPHYAQILAQANDEAELSFTDVELLSLPTEHALVGCTLAQNWWLPDEICLAIRHHHEKKTLELIESRTPISSRYMIAVAQLSEYLLQQCTGLSHTSEWRKLGASCLRLLGITEAELKAMQPQAAEVLRTVV